MQEQQLRSLLSMTFQNSFFKLQILPLLNEILNDIIVIMGNKKLHMRAFNNENVIDKKSFVMKRILLV